MKPDYDEINYDIAKAQPILKVGDLIEKKHTGDETHLATFRMIEMPALPHEVKRINTKRQQVIEDYEDKNAEFE